MQRRYCCRASVMPTYADVCWRMLTYADVCWRMLTYADEHLYNTYLRCSKMQRRYCSRASAITTACFPSSNKKAFSQLLHDASRIRQHTSAYVSIREEASASMRACIPSSNKKAFSQLLHDASRMRHHTSAYVSIRQEASASMKVWGHVFLPPTRGRCACT